jgi:hypothetical protein
MMSNSSATIGMSSSTISSSAPTVPPHNSSSPFYLHNGNTLGEILVTQLLSCGN